MSITSPLFFLFIAILLFLYNLVPQKNKWLVLLFGSYYFYGLFGLRFYFFLMVTTLSTFTSGYLIDLEEKKCDRVLSNLEKNDQKALKLKSKSKKKAYLMMSLFINFGMLIFLKYFDIVKSGLYALTQVEAFQMTQHLILPLGISFYIFQSIGYVSDVYWKKHDAEKNVFKFALFISFFPQIIQGPISRYKDLAPQLYKEHHWQDDDVKEGIFLVVLGLLKKMVIADRLSVLVNAVIPNHTQYSGSVILFTVLVYGVQIYCDFSGGIDVVRGIAKFFSIDLAINFNRPLFATSLSDFWRRWHITLGSWMRDYVFYPLSLSKWFGNFNKKVRKKFGPKLGKIMALSISTFVVYILVGLWHGPSLRFVVFGLWHGFLITFYLATEDWFKKKRKQLGISENNILLKVSQIILTTGLVTFGRYFSRAASLMQALSMFKRTLLNFNFKSLLQLQLGDLGLNESDLKVAFFSLCALLIYEFILEVKWPLKEKYDKLHGVIQVLIIGIALVIIGYYGFYAQGFVPAEFIYMQY